MREIIFVILSLVLSIPSLCSANTKVPADQVSVNTAPFNKNLNSSDNTAQAAFQTIDQLNTGGSTPGGVNTQIQYNNNGALGGANMYSVSTNIGVGTTLPAYLMDINGITAATRYIAKGTGPGTWWGPNGFQWDPFNFTADGSNLNPTMTISTNGNVGIGTESTLPGTGSYSAALGVHGVTFFSNINQTGSEPMQCYDLNGSNFGCWWNNDADSTVYYGGGNSYKTAPPSAFPYILSLGTDNGNVGIGTNDISAKLNVAGTAKMTGFQLTTNPTAGYVLTSNGVGIGTWQPSSGGSGAVSSVSNSDGTLTISPTTGSVVASLALSHANTWTGQQIFNTANVGINSATPAQRLDVSGTVRATNFIGTSLTASTPVIADANKNLISGSYSGNTTELGTVTGSLTNGHFASFDSSGNIKDSTVAATSAGIVGLFSTCSGTQYLGADGACHNAGGSSVNFVNTNTNDVYEANSGTYGNVGIGTLLTTNASLTILKNSTNPYLFINSTSGGGGNVFSITNGGNIGINSSNPGKTLDVVGTIRATAFIKSGGTSSQFLKADGSIDSTSYGNGTVTSVTLATPNSTLSLGGTNPVTTSGTINADLNLAHTNNWSADQEFAGNVGIGTTLTTTAALTVMNGNVGIGTWVPGGVLQIGSGASNCGTGNNCFTGNVGIGSNAPGAILDVEGTVGINSFASNVGIGSTNPAGVLDVGTGTVYLSHVGENTWGGRSPSFLSYQPGLLSAINSTIGVNYKISNASTVDNIIGSAVTFSCVSNPTVTMYECGTSTTCTSPTTIGSVTVTTAGTLVSGTVSNPAITAGDYVGWAMTAGTCASIDISVTSQIHTN